MRREAGPTEIPETRFRSGPLLKSRDRNAWWDDRAAKKAARRGFTLVEALVVMSLIGLLIALLLPAVQAARESSRRVQCQNNLRQIGMALLGYHDVHATLPPGRVTTADPRHMLPGVPCSGPVGRSFQVAILAQVEQSTLFHAINLGVTILGFENSTFHATSISLFACPSDPDSGRPRRGVLREPTLAPVADFAAVSYTSYAGMMGATYSNARPNPLRGCLVDPAQVARANGCFNDLSPLTLASITDGQGNTMMVVEKATTILRGVDNPSNPYVAEESGWWFLGYPDSTLVAAAYPINAYKTFPAFNSGAWLSASSLHPGGANALFADGHVRFIKETIESAPVDRRSGIPLMLTLGVWQKLATRNGGDVVSQGDY